jgi:hypothetical protein
VKKEKKDPTEPDSMLRRNPSKHRQIVKPKEDKPNMKTKTDEEWNYAEKKS